MSYRKPAPADRSAQLANRDPARLMLFEARAVLARLGANCWFRFGANLRRIG